jgi:hypothetical protein
MDKNNPNCQPMAFAGPRLGGALLLVAGAVAEQESHSWPITTAHAC